MRFFDRIYYSILFYCYNGVWNFSFWFFAKRIYSSYEVDVKNFGNQTIGKRPIKKFIGYEYKGKIYNDNPGFPIKERKQWEKWRKYKLIK